MSETYSGGCLCGGVQYVVTGPLRDVVNCHCGQCRRTHGHFAGYTEAPLADFKLKSSDSLKWYQSSPQARRGFCSICGASLFWVPEGGDHVCDRRRHARSADGFAHGRAYLCRRCGRLLHNRRRSENVSRNAAHHGRRQVAAASDAYASRLMTGA